MSSLIGPGLTSDLARGQIANLILSQGGTPSLRFGRCQLCAASVLWHVCARCGCASIGDVHEIHEVAKNRAARRRDCCRHLIVGCTGGIRARRLRSQPPSQCVWPMRIWRSKSKLVPENYGPPRYLRGRWSVALLEVIAFGGACGVQAENMRITY